MAEACLQSQDCGATDREKRMPVPGRGSSPAAAAAASSCAGSTSAWPRAVRHTSSSGHSAACGKVQPAGSAGTSTVTSPKRPPTRPAHAAKCADSACACVCRSFTRRAVQRDGNSEVCAQLQRCAAITAPGAGLGISARVGVADEVEGLQQRANPQKLVEGRHRDAVQHSLHLGRVGGGHGHVRYACRIQAPRHARQVAAGCTKEHVLATAYEATLQGTR